ncbi:Glycosyl transferase family 2 [Phyllobacterium sp. YR620]|uniref:glycosyltransferase family 2 protein n=1 Tax=Phyllobacterium sp. YR620 TaxID=1881066 RepID=UPI00089127AF|nr:glycosyltransferase family 2 protein [Phyllobacterium sp. YR620]SDP69666.1 Glycosyl transferase family 2 [Phyllobacterium sp. YR620]
MNNTCYPSRNSIGLRHRGFLAAVRTWLKERKAAPLLSSQLGMHQIATATSQYTDSDIAVVVPVRNERKFLGSFLAHYRKLGVARFIVIDDQSCDGTVEYLTAQNDVDLWRSTVRYADAQRSILWREWIFNHYGQNRWYLNLDVDEYLVYQDCYQRPITDVATHLSIQQHFRMAAPMIDLYPGEHSCANLSDDVPPWEIANQFDATGYVIGQASSGWSIKGGLRGRKFGLSNQLIKYPLTYWDSESSLSRGIHKPKPFKRNFGPIYGVLLHFKFFSDLKQKVDTAIHDCQYFSNAAEYQLIAKVLAETPELQLHDVQYSAGYEGPGQLIGLGFMRELWMIIAAFMGFASTFQFLLDGI